MKKVIVRGPLLSISGYGEHARQVFRWAISRPDFDVRVDITPWGMTSWHINPESEGGLIEKIMQKSNTQGFEADITLQIQLPNEWNPTLGKVNIGVTAAVEADKCNPEWVACCNRMSAVIVPSEFVKGVFTRTGQVNVPCLVVPEAYNSEMVSNDPGLKIEDIETKTNFLLVGQITGNTPETDRKNIFFTVKWFCETFKDDRNVGLIIKTNLGTQSCFLRNQTIDVFKKLISEVRQGEFPRVHLMTGEMTPTEIGQLYRSPKVDALISLTRGEGFGLPILEAAANDLPVIATGWSAHTEFLSKGKYIKIEYDMTPVHPSKVDNQIFMPGSSWAHPREEDAKKRMKKLSTSKEVPREWARELGRKIREDYSIESVIDKYNLALKDIV
jgi:glycosyltransferase involved in cell wall biosynthesis